MTKERLKVIRAEFYDKARKEYSATNEEIVRILKKAGYETFKADEIPSYNALIEEYFKRKLKPQEAPDAWRERVFPKPLTSPCPVADCEGTIITDYPVGTTIWRCSKYGSAHYNAYRVANHRAILQGYKDDHERIGKHARDMYDRKYNKENTETQNAQKEAFG